MVNDFLVTASMIEHGGGFVKRLAMAYRAADPENREKIKATWPECWAKYSKMAQMRENRR